jgi:hypothetical protein
MVLLCLKEQLALFIKLKRDISPIFPDIRLAGEMFQKIQESHFLRGLAAIDGGGGSAGAFSHGPGYYDLPWIKPFVRIARVIPIPSEVRPQEVIHALHRAGDAIRHGGIVCVFAGGQITRTGELNKFQRRVERIMKNVDSPVVPVALGGV